MWGGGGGMWGGGGGMWGGGGGMPYGMGSGGMPAFSNPPPPPGTGGGPAHTTSPGLLPMPGMGAGMPGMPHLPGPAYGSRPRRSSTAGSTSSVEGRGGTGQ